MAHEDKRDREIVGRQLAQDAQREFVDNPDNLENWPDGQPVVDPPKGSLAEEIVYGPWDHTPREFDPNDDVEVQPTSKLSRNPTPDAALRAKLYWFAAGMGFMSGATFTLLVDWMVNH